MYVFCVCVHVFPHVSWKSQHFFWYLNIQILRTSLPGPVKRCNDLNLLDCSMKWTMNVSSIFISVLSLMVMSQRFSCGVISRYMRIIDSLVFTVTCLWYFIYSVSTAVSTSFLKKMILTTLTIKAACNRGARQPTSQAGLSGALRNFFSFNGAHKNVATLPCIKREQSSCECTHSLPSLWSPTTLLLKMSQF